MADHYSTLSFTVAAIDKHHALKKALTHYSFYANEEDAKNAESSKFIFLGMYAFKGKVAEVMRKYIPLTGKQLQHYLGNVFKNKQLNYIYNKYHLERCVRYGNDFVLEQHRHVFVYALLGFVYQHAEEKHLLRFIYSNFLASTEHLMPGKSKSVDIWSQCLYVSKMFYNELPTLKIEENAGEYICHVMINEQSIAQHKSKSKTYARKKAIKNALLHIVEQQNRMWDNNPIMIELREKREKREAEKLAKEKALKLKAYREKQKKRSEIAHKRKQERKAINQQKDLERRKAKAKAKKRKEEQEAQRKKQKQDLANISVAKRRHLQDKGILKKGAPVKKK